MEFQFTKENTTICKGIAVIMLLVHHLFYSNTYSYSEIEIFGVNLWCTLAFLCKVTVAIFVMLSGYGLYKSFSIKNDIKDFYIRHLKKIYLNYWLIWLLFVPAGIIFYGRTLNVVYENHIISKLIINFLGLQQYFHFWGYNPTWWFITLIISLYIMFPILYALSKKKYLLEILFILSCFGFLSSFSIGFLLYFIPVFILGMLIAKYSLFEKAYKVVSRNRTNLILGLAIFSLLLLCRIHFGQWFVIADAGKNTIFDMFIAFFIILYSCFIRDISNKSSISDDIYIYIYISSDILPWTVIVRYFFIPYFYIWFLLDRIYLCSKIPCSNIN